MNHYIRLTSLHTHYLRYFVLTISSPILALFKFVNPLLQCMPRAPKQNHSTELKLCTLCQSFLLPHRLPSPRKQPFYCSIIFIKTFHSLKRWCSQMSHVSDIIQDVPFCLGLISVSRMSWRAVRTWPMHEAGGGGGEGILRVYEKTPKKKQD